MSHTKEDIFKHIANILEDQFEIEPDKISMDARLMDDLDIDSIDAVDLMIELKSLTGKKMALEDFQEVKTLGDVVDAIHRLVHDESQNAQAQ